MNAFTNMQNSLQATFATLSARERRLVGLASFAIMAFVLFLVMNSFSAKGAAIRRRTAENLAKLEEVQVLAAGYGQARANQEAAEQQLAASNVRLISYLEEKAKAAGVELPTFNSKPDQALEGTKIVETSVEVTLTDVPLNRLVQFLTSVEAGPGVVKVRTMRMEPRVSNETITAWLTIATYHLKN